MEGGKELMITVKSKPPVEDVFICTNLLFISYIFCFVFKVKVCEWLIPTLKYQVEMITLNVGRCLVGGIQPMVLNWSCFVFLKYEAGKCLRQERKTFIRVYSLPLLHGEGSNLRYFFIRLPPFP